MATSNTPARESFYTDHKAALWALAIATPILVVAAGVLLAPETFYDRFIWKHLWGPIVADAQQTGTAIHNGVAAREGYTVLSEVVYGVTLAALLFGIYRHVLQRFHVTADGWFILALLPYICLGPTTRALEDAWVFSPGGDPSPFAYLFISPVIYAHIAVYAIAFLLLGVLVESAANRLEYAPGDSEPRALAVMLGLVAAPLLAMVFAYAGITALWGHTLNEAAPVGVVVAAAAAAFAIYAYGLEAWGAKKNLVLFVMGLPLLAPAVWLIGKWVLVSRWFETDGWPRALHPEAAAAAFGLAALVTVLVFIVGRSLGKDAPHLAVYAAGVNLALVFGHMLDGFATYIAIEDPLGFGITGYGEKHPLSDYFLGIADGLGFPILKLIMILLIIHLLDREFQDREEDKNLVGLVKMAIFVLGFAPGLRDVVRVTMGI